MCELVRIDWVELRLLVPVAPTTSKACRYSKMPTLVPAYTAYSGPDGTTVAAALPMLTIAPRLRAFMPGRTTRVIWMTILGVSHSALHTWMLASPCTDHLAVLEGRHRTA